MATQTKTLNLFPFFAAWTAIFIILAAVNHSMTLVVVAVAPIALWFGLWLLLSITAGIVIWVAYMRGHPIKVTTPRKGTRMVRRGR